MKQIKGKIDFVVIPINEDGVYYTNSDEKQAQSLYFNMPWFYLSEIKENEACLFVDGNNGGMSDTMWLDCLSSEDDFARFTKQTAKESLVSLLKANDCWIKEWKEKPNINDFKSIPFCESGECKAYYDELNEYNKTPDDFLIIKTK